MDKLRHKEVKVISPNVTERLKTQREESNPSSLNSEFKFLTTMFYISGEMEI